MKLMNLIGIILMNSNLKMMIVMKISYEESIRLAYMPCAAHNLQLVINDGYDDEPKILETLKSVTKNIISRSSYSHVIAEALREIGSYSINLFKHLKSKHLKYKFIRKEIS